jgi:hypothetical protein
MKISGLRMDGRVNNLCKNKGKGNFVLALSLTDHHDMKAYWEAEV